MIYIIIWEVFARNFLGGKRANLRETDFTAVKNLKTLWLFCASCGSVHSKGVLISVSRIPKQGVLTAGAQSAPEKFYYLIFMRSKFLMGFYVI